MIEHLVYNTRLSSCNFENTVCYVQSNIKRKFTILWGPFTMVVVIVCTEPLLSATFWNTDSKITTPRGKYDIFSSHSPSPLEQHTRYRCLRVTTFIALPHTEMLENLVHFDTETPATKVRSMQLQPVFRFNSRENLQRGSSSWRDENNT